MPQTTVTLSSAAVTTSTGVNSDGSACALSNAINLDTFSGKPTTAWVRTNSSVGSGNFTVQVTLDDVSSASVWFGVSSTPYTIASNPGVHFVSSNIWPDGVFLPFTTPLGGIRLASTALSSNTLTLKVIQGEGG